MKTKELKKVTIEELEQIKKEREKKDKYHNLCVNLNICPVCNSTIIFQSEEILDKPRKYLFGLIVIKKLKWDFRMICEKDKSHYELKYDYSTECG